MYFILGTAIANAQPSFQTIGTLQTSANTVSYAFGVSQDGTYVVGDSNSIGGTDAIRWSAAGGLESIPRLPNTSNYYAFDVSSDGSYVLGQYGQHGFVWSESFGTVAVGDLPGGTVRSVMTSIGDDGTAVGTSSFGFAPNGSPLNRAIRWTPSGGIEALPLPGANDLLSNSQANVALPDGRIFGRSASGAWLYDERNGTFEMLPDADGMIRANPDGTFFGGQDSLGGGARAAYWTRDEGLTFLPVMDGHVFSNFRGMSDDGSVITGISIGQSDAQRVVWLNRGAPIRVIDYATSLGLDMEGWVISDVFDVSADGSTIVGSARHVSWESGHLEGFVLTIPAPASAGVLAAFGLGAMRRRRCGAQQPAL